jgi:type IV pilus assembly protein PilY1
MPEPASRDVETYNPAAPQRWQFPFTAGHLYEHDLSALSTALTGQTFGAGKRWDAAARMPLPGSRRVFTVLGGSAHVGWKRVDFWHDQVTADTCTDADADDKCDLAEALAACGTAGITGDLLKAKTDSTAEGVRQRNVLGEFVQQVRGFCSAHSPRITGTPNFTPADNDCDDPRRQDNRAKLGGIDHGSPAIVGPSRYVTTTPWSNRPVVAYVGGRDGMLHAIYVSGGSANWTADGKTLPAGIDPGTELWAMIPPGQICGLLSNDAMVDASVNVIDVFGDFPSDADNDGVIDWGAANERPTGVRRWRTLLLATTAAGSELFTLDVTNPLKPVLLWHVGGATEKDGRWDANADGDFADTGDTKNDNDPRTYAVKWTEATDSTGLSAVNGVTKSKTGRFDYRNLGLAYGTAVGKVWEGNAFRNIAYFSTSTADYTNETPDGFRGIEVFAVDLVTGQKLWQWQRRYARKNGAGNVIADNAIPGRPALADVDSDGQVDRIYVGDLEGHLWELDARAGGNINYLPSTASTSLSPAFYSFPLYGTPQMTGEAAATEISALFTLASGGLAQQPLTTAIGLGRFTEVPATPVGLAPLLLNRLALVQGTMGVNWSIAPYEAGRVIVLPAFWEYDTRIAYWSEGTKVNLNEERNPRMFGVLRPAAVWTVDLDVGERVFGMPRILNNRIIFTTSYGGFNGDISETASETGELHIVSSTGDANEAIPTKAMGGVLVFEDKLVITTSTSMRVKDAPAGGTGGPAQRPFNRATPALFKTWERPEVTGVKR